LEVPAENLGQFATCPHCHEEIPLDLPAPAEKNSPYLYVPKKSDFDGTRTSGVSQDLIGVG
jgi:hypothetical protein